MKPEEKLDSLLREWRCDYAVDPWLEERVWLRINEEETRENVVFWDRFSWLQSPAWAAALLVLAVAGGIGAAEWQTRNVEAMAGEAETYFQSINPIALAGVQEDPGQ